MANKITETNCLEAELVLGYKYYEQKEKYAKEVADCKHKINDLNNVMFEERNKYIARRDGMIISDSYILAKHPEWQQEYNEYCAKKHALVKKQDKADFIDKKTREMEGSQKAVKYSLIVGAVFLLLTVLFNVLGAVQAGGDYGKAYVDGNGWVIAGSFMGFIAVMCLFMVLAHRGIVASAKREMARFTSKKLANVEPLWSYIRGRLTDTVKKELGQEYDTDHQAEIDAFTKKEEETKEQIEVKKKALSAICETERKLLDYGANLPAKLTVIPAYYFKADAVEKMLFFYVNKRADNVRDLINLYETTVFQEAVLKSLKDIAVSVDKLTDAVRGGFTRLGLQLGVVNESIQENTKQQRLNREKLSEIKDENARHYLDIVDAIDDIEIITNTHVTVQA